MTFVGTDFNFNENLNYTSGTIVTTGTRAIFTGKNKNIDPGTMSFNDVTFDMPAFNDVTLINNSILVSGLLDLSNNDSSADINGLNILYPVKVTL